jgi:hypothetical protein
MRVKLAEIDDLLAGDECADGIDLLAQELSVPAAYALRLLGGASESRLSRP